MSSALLLSFSMLFLFLARHWLPVGAQYVGIFELSFISSLSFRYIYFFSSTFPFFCIFPSPVFISAKILTHFEQELAMWCSIFMPPGHFQSRCAQFTREELSPPPKPAAQPPLFSMPLLLQQQSQQQGLCPFTRASDGITQMAGYVPHVAGRAFPKEGQATTSTSKQGGRTSFGHKHPYGRRCHLKTNHQWWQAREKIFFSETTLIQAFVLKLWSAFLGESCQPMREGRHHARTWGTQYVHRQASLLPCQSLGRALPSSYHSFGYEVPGGLSSKITAVTFSCF